MSGVACDTRRRLGLKGSGGYEATAMGAGNSGPLEKQQVLLTRELSLQPLDYTPNDHSSSFF